MPNQFEDSEGFWQPSYDAQTSYDSSSGNSRDPDIEDNQIQLALELSAREDPEAIQIEAVKQISLGSCPSENTLYGVLTESTSSRMPSHVDLQGAPVSDNISWEAILVNRAADSNMLKLEQEALEMAVKSRLESLNVVVIALMLHFNACNFYL